MKTTQITLTELENNRALLDSSIARKLIYQNNLLNLLPLKSGKNISYWARCIVVCEKCNWEEGYICIKRIFRYCPKCGKETMFIPRYKVVFDKEKQTINVF